MIVVSDSSPLIYLAALSDFSMLPRLFGRVVIPLAVWREVVEEGCGGPGEEAVRQARTEGWLTVIPLHEPAASIRVAGHELHAGETEVIRLAEQTSAGILLMDDRPAVLHARSLGYQVVPTIAIYILAKHRGLLPMVRVKLDLLRAAGFRLTQEDYGAVLKAAGE